MLGREATAWSAADCALIWRSTVLLWQEGDPRQLQRLCMACTNGYFLTMYCALPVYDARLNREPEPLALGSVAACERLMCEGVDLLRSASSSNSALHKARSKAVVRFLLDSGADLATLFNGDCLAPPLVLRWCASGAGRGWSVTSSTRALEVEPLAAKTLLKPKTLLERGVDTGGERGLEGVWNALSTPAWAQLPCGPRSACSTSSCCTTTTSAWTAACVRCRRWWWVGV